MALGRQSKHEKALDRLRTEVAKAREYVLAHAELVETAIGMLPKQGKSAKADAARVNLELTVKRLKALAETLRIELDATVVDTSLLRHLLGAVGVVVAFSVTATATGALEAVGQDIETAFVSGAEKVKRSTTDAEDACSDLVQLTAREKCSPYDDDGGITLGQTDLGPLRLVRGQPSAVQASVGPTGTVLRPESASTTATASSAATPSRQPIGSVAYVGNEDEDNDGSYVEDIAELDPDIYGPDEDEPDDTWEPDTDQFAELRRGRAEEDAKLDAAAEAWFDTQRDEPPR